MSDKHTQGRLIARGGYSIYADDGKTPVADTCLTNSVPGNDEANARRLVACWNACEGLPTAWIEGGAADILEHAKSLKSQRDELLATLKELLSGIFDGPDESDAARLIAKARAAIAKAEAK